MSAKRFRVLALLALAVAVGAWTFFGTTWSTSIAVEVDGKPDSNALAVVERARPELEHCVGERVHSATTLTLHIDASGKPTLPRIDQFKKLVCIGDVLGKLVFSPGPADVAVKIVHARD